MNMNMRLYKLPCWLVTRRIKSQSLHSFWFNTHWPPSWSNHSKPAPSVHWVWLLFLSGMHNPLDYVPTVSENWPLNIAYHLCDPHVSWAVQVWLCSQLHSWLLDSVGISRSTHLFLSHYLGFPIPIPIGYLVPNVFLISRTHIIASDWHKNHIPVRLGIRSHSLLWGFSSLAWLG